MEKKFLFILIIISYLFRFSFALDTLDKVDGISAIVGDEIILDSEVKRYLSNNKSKTYCKVLEYLINQKLILYYMKKNPMIQKITDQEIQSKIENNIPKIGNGLGNDDIEKLTENIRNDQYIELFYQNMENETEISPGEIKSFLQKEKLPVIPNKVCISYMMISPIYSDKNRNKIIDFLKRIKKEIHSDNDFSMKAILFSEDYSSSLNGGLITGLNKENISKEFEYVISSLKEKQISEPFETDLGFHLIMLEKDREKKVDIRHILIQPKYTNDDLIHTKSIIYKMKNILYKNQKLSFKDILNNYTSQERKKFFVFEKIWLEENNISENMKKELKKLKIGEVSEPYKEIYNGKEKFFIFKLLEKKYSHTISLKEDYIELKNFLNKKKMDKKIKNWIQKKLKNTYIKVDKSLCT
ncbi:peptidylprolyl isomerase [Blattabacterium cuenoti]|uniref:peptidylprolyl isomerase n=1 Tax=Blattabacterium cuenoti TaxID=1653831 RepID=UPI00163C3DD4|nr:peptidylprolyl isomerase [Blattabacterium cuenoti]